LRGGEGDDVYYIYLDEGFDKINDASGDEDWFGFVGREFLNNPHSLERVGDDLIAKLYSDVTDSSILAQVVIENHFTTGAIEFDVIWDQDTLEELEVFEFCYLNPTDPGSDNLIIGSTSADTLSSGAGDDAVYAGAGDDNIIAASGMGDDFYDGGGGTDTVIFSSANAGIFVDLMSESAGSISDDAGIGQDIVRNIENVIAGSFNDRVFGDTKDNVVDGGIGDDVVFGGLGNDSLEGGAGDDTLEGGIGADTVDGGNGTDVLSYSGSSGGVIVDLLTGGAFGFDAAGDLFSNVEGLSGSGFFDILLGGLDDNTLDGGGGNDFVFGRFGDDMVFGGEGDDALFGDDASGFPDGIPGIDYGADQLYGGAGNDNMYGEGGADFLDGGADTDLANYETSPLGVVVDLANSIGYGPEGSYSVGDTYANVENVRGSAFDDILIGTTGDNVLEGGGGNDLLIGSVGADILSGGAGVDTFAISSVSEGGDIIADFSPTDGEKIDLSTLFAAHGLPTDDPVGDGILRIEDLLGNGQHTAILLDLDGFAGDDDPFTLYTLVNTDADDVEFGTHVIV